MSQMDIQYARIACGQPVQVHVKHHLIIGVQLTANSAVWITLQTKAKSEGLWNLFLTKDYDPSCQYGAGLTNVEYAFIAQEMGRSPIGSEVSMPYF